MRKQTAVEWLVEQLTPTISIRLSDTYIKELKEKAKAMEKEQMDKVSEDWFVEGCSHMKDNTRIYKSFKYYYQHHYE
jgi:hypothetical protein